MKHILTTAVALLLLGYSQLQGQEIMLLKTSGKVVIGDTTQITTPGMYNLYVQNGILTERVKVAVKTTSEWSDDAWEHTPALTEVQQKIASDKHLPGMPSADELVSTGYDVQQMDAKLLAQVEWLWQHMIALDAKNKELEQQLAALKLSTTQKED